MRKHVVLGIAALVGVTSAVAARGAETSEAKQRGILVVSPSGVARGGFSTIQAAVDAAATGDTVVIPEGVFSGPGNKDVLVDKSITLKGIAKPKETVIDCEGSGRGFHFTGAVDQDTTLMSVKVINGNATNGGGILIDGVDPVIKKCVFESNTASRGGGAYVSNATVRFLAVDCLGNTATIGGGMCFEGTDGTVRGSHLHRNHAAVLGGGVAIFAPLGPDVFAAGMSFSDSVIGSNSTDGSSGGLYLEFADTFRMDRCIVARNSAVDSTGGVGVTGDFLIFFSDTAYFMNSMFVQNTAGTAAGLTVGAIGAVIQNCTVADNAATGSVGGLSVAGDGIYMLNTILWGNSGNDPSVFEEQLFLAVPIQLFDNNDVEGAIFDPTSISEDPLFVDPAARDYRLSPESPCVDAGFSPLNVVTQRDFERDPRLFGPSVDIGADERSAAPARAAVGRTSF